MKISKKICSIILACALTLGTFPAFGASASQIKASPASIVRPMTETSDNTASPSDIVASTINVQKLSVSNPGITLDGALNEGSWNTMYAASKQIEGTEKTINTGFNVTWDNENMYIGVRVTSNASAKTSFDKDTVTYYLAPKNNRGNYSNDDFQVQISDKGNTVKAGCLDWPKNASLQVSKISVAYQAITNGYTMEIKMPWSVVGFVPQGTSNMGFDLMAFDGDVDSNGNSNCIMGWQGDSNDWKSTANFGTLIFQGDGTEPNGQTLTLKHSIFAPGSEIGMSYTNAVDGDAIAIVPVGGKLTEQVLSKDLTAGSGTCTITANENTLSTGNYDAVFYKKTNGPVYARQSFSIGEVKISTDQSSYARLDKSAIVINFNDAASGSWIGIYHADQTPGGNSPSIVWAYTNTASGSMQFTSEDFQKALSTDYLRSGSYKAILFKDGGYTIDQVCPFTVTGAQLTLNTTKYTTDLNISVDYSGTNVNGKDWIGIYPKGATPSGNNVSFAWKYAIGSSGTMTFTQKDIMSRTDSTLHGKPLPAGDYELILCANDGYSILDRAEFTITDALKAPVSVTYNRTGKTGYADGTATIADSGNPATIAYKLYWGDANGKLSGYDVFDTVIRTGDSTVYTVTPNTFIPQNATKLLAYASDGTNESDTPVSVDIPDSAKFSDERPLYTFDVMSDTHIQSWDSDQNTHLGIALKDIKKNDANSSGIFVVGDMVDQGFAANYKNFFSILDANKNGLPPVNLVIGNHEFMDFSTSNPYTNEDGKLQQWLNETNRTIPYYDKYINGQHFIMLGSEDMDGAKQSHVINGDNCDISETQFNWLRAKLAETKDKKQPIFLFLHQPMANTVAGSYDTPVQGWHSMYPDQEKELRSILKDYPQVVLFDGHTHWLLESANEMYDGGSSFADIFNTAAVGYLWSDANVGIAGAEGLYIEVYKDKILVKGRNYTSGLWVSKSFYSVDLSEKYNNITLGNSGNSGNQSGAVNVPGAQGSDGTTTATLKASDIGTGAPASVVFGLGSTTLKFPTSVALSALGAGSTLTLSQSTPSQDAQAKIQAAAASAGVNPALVVNYDLNSVDSTGKATAVHNLSGNVTVTMALTDAQLAAIAADPKKAHLYYYDPQTGKLTDMNATFDLASKTVTFTTNHFSTYLIATSDNTLPAVSGVANNGIYNSDKAIIFNKGMATLDGTVFTSGSTVSAEGKHTLVVTDTVGNSTTVVFTIDKTAPKVFDISENSVYTASKKITFDEGTATLDGAAFTSGTTVKESGKHTLVVTDAAGNCTTVDFVIDKNAPVLAIKSGKTVLKNGAISPSDVTVSVSDLFTVGKSVTLNGKRSAWPSNGKFTKDGKYSLTVKDEYGRATTRTFILDKTVPKIAVSRIKGGVKVSVTDANLLAKKVTFAGKTIKWSATNTFTKKGSYSVLATDKAGHKSTRSFRI